MSACRRGAAGALALLLAFLPACGAPRQAEAPLATTRLPAPVNDDVKLDLLFRRDLLPQVRRETTLRLVVDLADQPDLTALAAEADARGLTRSQRKAFVAAALARGVPSRAALAADLRKMPDVSDVVEASCLARVSFTGPARLAKELAARPEVAWAWGRPLSPASLPSPPAAHPPGEGQKWGPAGVRALEAWAKGYRGQGAQVCVLESAAATVPPSLRGRSATLSNAKDVPGLSLPDEGHGHGLAVLAAAVGSDGLGVAPDAAWSVVNPLGGGVLDPEAFAAAVDWVLTTAQPDVVVMPWDVPDSVPAYQLAIPVGALRTAGMAVVLPAGNTGPVAGDNRPPANLTSVAPDGAPAFSVGGIAQDLGPYEASSRGPNARDGSLFPMVCAPASDLTVVDPDAGGVRAGFGTSFASGFAGGALAIVLAAHPEMTGPQAEKLLRDTARDLGTPGPDNTFGHGLIDLAAALKLNPAP